MKAETPRKEGADVVFECAGFLPATPEGLGYTRRSGTFVEVGHFVDMGSIDFNINQLLMRKNFGSKQSGGAVTNTSFAAYRFLNRVDALCRYD